MTDAEDKIWEEIQKQKKQDTQAKVLGIIARLLLLFTVASFLFSPCFQLILRIISPYEGEETDSKWIYIRHSVVIYQDMIQKINMLALFTAILCYIYFATTLIRNRKNNNHKKDDYKNNNRKLAMLPLFLMWSLALIIPFVTILRGTNEYDLVGHPYMYESIFSYMLYPTCYFFCGVFIWQSKYKKGLLYLLIASAAPINILSLINEWIADIPIYFSDGVSAVFHNSNHYGYYLLIVILASLLLFVYEEKIVLKLINAISAVLGIMVLIINNTLGAYLAILIVLIAFNIYCFIKDRAHLAFAIGAFAIFIVTTLALSFHYNTILSSFVTLFGDIGMIANDPLESDSAGSSRWKLWKGTVENMHESPWLGFGVEGLLNTHGVGTPHNELLQYAEFFGIPAMLIYLSAVLSVIVPTIKHAEKLDNMTLTCFCISIGYFISSMFGVAIYYTTPFFYIFLGLTYAERMHKNSEIYSKNI